MAEKICVIIGSAPVAAGELREMDRMNRFVVCADGGYDAAMQSGVIPDLLIGDFDSIRSELPKDVETRRGCGAVTADLSFTAFWAANEWTILSPASAFFNTSLPRAARP